MKRNMTANDIIGNLRMFVNCNRAFGNESQKSIYMSKDTFDALCSIFQAAAWAQYPYDLGQQKDGLAGATIYGADVMLDNNMEFGAVRMGDQAEYYKLLMGDI